MLKKVTKHLSLVLTAALLAMCVTLALVVSPTASAADSGWSEAYQEFVLSERYKSVSALYRDDGSSREIVGYSGKVFFALHDMDGSGIPELVFDLVGDWGHACEFYAFQGNEVKYVGNSYSVNPTGRSNWPIWGSGPLYYAPGTKYYGLADMLYDPSIGWQRIFVTYHSVPRGEELGIAAPNMDEHLSWTEIIFSQVTENDDLYRCFLDIEEGPIEDMYNMSFINTAKELKTYNIDEIQSMGWDAFVAQYIQTTSYSADSEAINEPGYGFVETPADDGRVEDQTVYTLDQLTDQAMHCEGAYSEFRALYLDQKQLTRDVDYTAEDGSTKITIESETFEKAGSGTHTLAAEFQTSGKTVYTVQEYTVTVISEVAIPVIIKGTPLVYTDSAAYIDANNRTQVPFRIVGEALGLTVSWDGDAREAGFTDGTKTIIFPIGSTAARTSDGGTVQMDTAAAIAGGRTYAPVRYLAEFFGYTVDWDGATRTVIIT